ncbi:hypothetical protein [Neisseria sp. Ec49-e6-T10]|uniref:hypothetical protein n=1 Tax=Neisseria sp. Ec49-e6-T10 TaxID=3140744 RepID=UPI003EBACBFE
MCIKYNKAPLPFLGQKRNFLKLIRELDFSNKTVIDLFGGSGLLSHTIKQKCPSARVIYNDFDDYKSRLDQIGKTEKLRQQLAELLCNEPKASRIKPELKAKIIELLKTVETNDWITVSSWLCFSGHYHHTLDDLIKAGWYARVVRNPLAAAGYLEGVERVQCDFRELIAQYSTAENVIYIADPPYIMTNQQGYAPAKADKWFRLGEAIELIQALSQKQAVFFSSQKSETDDLLDVWKPKTLDKRIYKASVGDGRYSIEHMFLLNW